MNKLPRNRCYSALTAITSFDERLKYLALYGTVGSETFGFDRIFNQDFYASYEWRSMRDRIIVRDGGCDLGMKDRKIFGPIYVHHMNPIMIDDIRDATEYLLNPEYLICTSRETHNAIHYGTTLTVSPSIVERSPNDTILWRPIK